MLLAVFYLHVLTLGETDRLAALSPSLPLYTAHTLSRLLACHFLMALQLLYKFQLLVRHLASLMLVLPLDEQFGF